MYDKNIKVGDWITLEGTASGVAQRLSRCEYEYLEPTVTKCVGEHPEPGIRCASWDIETYHPDPNALPRPTGESIDVDMMRTWMISTCIMLHNVPDSGKTILHILRPPLSKDLTVESILEVTGNTVDNVRIFDEEKEMLEDWRDVIITERVQCFLGYNTGNYE